jgi:hypothetical protein
VVVVVVVGGGGGGGVLMPAVMGIEMRVTVDSKPWKGVIARFNLSDQP